MYGKLKDVDYLDGSGKEINMYPYLKNGMEVKIVDKKTSAIFGTSYNIIAPGQPKIWVEESCFEYVKEEEYKVEKVQKYRKRPVIIEAVLWTGSNFEEIGLLIGDKQFGDHEWLDYTDRSPDGAHEIEIGTLEGKMIAHPGDYIIKGVKGELYPCKADIFTMTYELVDSYVHRTIQPKDPYLKEYCENGKTATAIAYTTVRNRRAALSLGKLIKAISIGLHYNPDKIIAAMDELAKRLYADTSLPETILRDCDQPYTIDLSLFKDIVGFRMKENNMEPSIFSGVGHHAQYSDPDLVEFVSNSIDGLHSDPDGLEHIDELVLQQRIDAFNECAQSRRDQEQNVDDIAAERDPSNWTQIETDQKVGKK